MREGLRSAFDPLARPLPSGPDQTVGRFRGVRCSDAVPGSGQGQALCGSDRDADLGSGLAIRKRIQHWALTTILNAMLSSQTQREAAELGWIPRDDERLRKSGAVVEWIGQ